MFNAEANYKSELTVTFLSNYAGSQRAVCADLADAYRTIALHHANAYVIRRGTKIIDRRM